MIAVVAVVVPVLVVLGLRFRALIRRQIRREERRLEALARVIPAPVDPIDWDLVAAQPTEQMRAIRIGGAA